MKGDPPGSSLPSGSVGYGLGFDSLRPASCAGRKAWTFLDPASQR